MYILSEYAKTTFKPNYNNAVTLNNDVVIYKKVKPCDTNVGIIIK